MYKIFFSFLFCVSILNARSLDILLINNEGCKLLISKNATFIQNGDCPDIDEMYSNINRKIELEKYINLHDIDFISDKFFNDKKIIKYFFQHEVTIDRSYYIKLRPDFYKNSEINLMHLLHGQTIYIKNVKFTFNKIVFIKGFYYIVINKYNSIVDKRLRKLIFKLNEDSTLFEYNF